MIDEIKEYRKGSWEQYQEEVRKLSEEKLGLSNVIIERAYRVKNSGESNICPGTIACNLMSYNGKVLISKRSNKLEVANIDINENFSYDKTIHRKQLWQQEKNLRSEGNLAYLNCRPIVVR